MSKNRRGAVEVVHFTLRGEHIALCDLLKAAGVVDSGGAGKAMVTQGVVWVDEQLESRKSAKIRGGQCVKVPGITILTHAEDTATPARA